MKASIKGTIHMKRNQTIDINKKNAGYLKGIEHFHRSALRIMVCNHIVFLSQLMKIIFLVHEFDVYGALSLLQNYVGHL